MLYIAVLCSNELCSTEARSTVFVHCAVICYAILRCAVLRCAVEVYTHSGHHGGSGHCASVPVVAILPTAVSVHPHCMVWYSMVPCTIVQLGQAVHDGAACALAGPGHVPLCAP